MCSLVFISVSVLHCKYGMLFDTYKCSTNLVKLDDLLLKSYSYGYGSVSSNVQCAQGSLLVILNQLSRTGQCLDLTVLRVPVSKNKLGSLHMQSIWVHNPWAISPVLHRFLCLELYPCSKFKLDWYSYFFWQKKEKKISSIYPTQHCTRYVYILYVLVLTV